MTFAALNPKDASVLLVEDNNDDAIITVRALETFGIKHIYHASTAEDAVDFLSSRHCDVVLVDYGLPGMNGLRLLEKLRTLDPQAKVIFVTGARDEKVAVDALKGGAADYISKDELLTSGIIRSLQDALRAQIATRESDRASQLASGAGTLDVALAEADWLVAPAREDARKAQSLSMVSVAEADAQDARDAFVGYLEACGSGQPFEAEEQGLVRMLVERGASPAEIVTIFRSAVRSLLIDDTAGGRQMAVSPTVCLARIMAGLVDEYQGRLSQEAYLRRAS